MRIKICCIQSEDEIANAVREGAHALGFVSTMPSGLRTISISRIRDLVRAVPPTYSTVLLTALTDPAAVLDQQRSTGVNSIQLVGPMRPEEVAAIRAGLPGIALFKTIHVGDESAISYALSFASVADVLLLDSGDPSAKTPRLGGTGETHDWGISREIVRRSPLPVFLAGGLSPKNVAEAVRSVRPFGVDVCSRLRPSGRLDPSLLRDFIRGAMAPA
jgi:phosphoribosylanthranilate isomerase